MIQDPPITQATVKDAAKINGDLDPGRKASCGVSPKCRLESEFENMAGKTIHEIRPNIEAEPVYIYDLVKAARRRDTELPGPEIQDTPCRVNQMPDASGMTHVEHDTEVQAQMVQRVTQRAKCLMSRTDGSTMLANAYPPARAERIRTGRGQMAFVKIQPPMTIDEKRDVARASSRCWKPLVRCYKIEDPLAMS